MMPRWRRRTSSSCASIAWAEPHRFRRRSPDFSDPGHRSAGAISPSGCRLATSSSPWTSAAKAWRHQLAALSRVRRIAPDLRGVGGSGVPPGADGYSLTRYADDLAAVLDALGVRQAVVCGLSMGGYVTFELLRRHPARVKALILADTKPQADSVEAKRRSEERRVGKECLTQCRCR